MNTQRIKVKKLAFEVITIGFNKWLLFKRERDIKSNEESISVTLVDNMNESKTKLGVLKRGRWNFPSERNASTFWKHAKLHSGRFGWIIKHLNTPINEFEPVLVEWNCFKRKFKLETIKISKKIKHLILQA